MELASNYDAVTSFFTNSDNKNMEAFTQETIEDLKAKIAALELELHIERKAAERTARLLQVMRGDDFNDESLH